MTPPKPPRARCEYSCVRQANGAHHESCPANPSPTDGQPREWTLLKRNYGDDNGKPEYCVADLSLPLSARDPDAWSDVHVIEHSAYAAVCAEREKYKHLVEVSWTRDAIDNLERKLTAAREEIAREKCTADNFRHNFMIQETTLASAEEALTAAKEEIAELTKRRDEANQKLTVVCEYREEIEEQLSEARAEVERLSRQLKHCEESFSYINADKTKALLTECELALEGLLKWAEKNHEMPGYSNCILIAIETLAKLAKAKGGGT